MDRGAWEATVHGVAKSRTRLSNFTTNQPISIYCNLDLETVSILISLLFLQSIDVDDEDINDTDIDIGWLVVKLLSRVRLCATPWTTVYQAPPSMGFSRQEYWSGVPLSKS